jgi:hypothetical protein
MMNPIKGKKKQGIEQDNYKFNLECATFNADTHYSSAFNEMFRNLAMRDTVWCKMLACSQSTLHKIRKKWQFIVPTHRRFRQSTLYTFLFDKKYLTDSLDDDAEYLDPFFAEQVKPDPFINERLNQIYNEHLKKNFAQPPVAVMAPEELRKRDILKAENAAHPFPHGSLKMRELADLEAKMIEIGRTNMAAGVLLTVDLYQDYLKRHPFIFTINPVNSFITLTPEQEKWEEELDVYQRFATPCKESIF